MPWYLPRLARHAVCDPWSQLEFTTVLGEEGQQCGHCLADCQSTEYHYEATEARFR